MNKIIILFLLLFFTQQTTSSNLVNSGEYDCIVLFFKKFNISTFYDKINNVYDYCNKNPMIQCDSNGSINGILTLTNISPIINELDVSDLTCLSNFTKLYLKNFKVRDNFLYHKFEKCSSVGYSECSFISNSIYQMLPSYTALIIQNTNSFENSTLKMSYLNNLEQFILNPEPVYLEVDTGSDKKKLKVLDISVLNVPILTDYSFTFLIISFHNSSLSYFNISSLSNLKYITSDYLSLYSTITLPTSLLEETLLTNNKVVQIDSPFEELSATINFLEISLYFKLIISNAVSLNFEGKYPFLVPPNGQVSLIGGNISSIEPISQFGTSNIITVVSSRMGGILGSYDTNLNMSSYNFGGNKISGTLDESWCDTQIDVSNNNMFGEIPSCFTCYFSAPSNSYLQNMILRFKGNSFTNWDTNIPCTKFAPKVNIYFGVDKTGLVVYGTDIGYDPLLWLLNGVENCNGFDTVSTGKSYICYLPTKNWLDEKPYFSILFTHPGNKSITFSNSLSTPPSISSVTFTSNNKLSIIGSFFSSYNGFTNQNVTLGNGLNCSVESVDFFNIVCVPTQVPLLLNPVPLTVSTSGLTKTVLINMGNSIINKEPCPNDCSRGSTPGICNLNTGVCNCSDPNSAIDCGSLIPCQSDCEPNGNTCDHTTGTCICSLNRFGEHCEFILHTISSNTPSTVDGGESTFYGSFGNEHSNLSLTIGDKPCSPITFNSSNIIKCIAPPGTGLKTVTLSQNGYTFTGKDIYLYIEHTISCPGKKDCSNRGTCNTNTGVCQCNKGYGLYDCSALINVGGVGVGGDSIITNTTIDQSTGSAIINDEQTNFQIYFKSLKEVDINDNVVNEYRLLNNWIYNNTANDNSKIYEFKQLINGTNCVVKSIIEEVTNENGKDFTFAGTTFKIENNGIKFTISVANYNYQNNLNTLKLDLVSSVDQNQLVKNNCNTQDTEIDIDGIKDQSTFSFIKISKNKKILSGRFINKVISDERPTFFTTTAKNNENSIIITLNLPHCTNECIIDPDFSVLVESDFKVSCSSSNNRKWVVPVAVVVSVVGFLIIGLGIFLIYKKNTTLKIYIHKLKRFN